MRQASVALGLDAIPFELVPLRHQRIDLTNVVVRSGHVPPLIGECRAEQRVGCEKVVLARVDSRQPRKVEAVDHAFVAEDSPSNLDALLARRYG